MATNKGFIKDSSGAILLPITRGELILDASGNIAFHSEQFLAKLPSGAEGDNGLPGLMTGAEKALLETLSSDSGSTGGTIGDIYSKLNYINTGLTIADVNVSFYNDSDGQTPISIKAGPGISITNDEQDFSIGLTSIGDKSVEKLINNIVVDTYGRVASVSGIDVLDNSQIPGTLINKTLSNCTTTVADNASDDVVVNKSYVDTKFNAVTAVATGALKYDGYVNNTNLSTIINDLSNRKNYYYKVTEVITIDSNNIHDATVDQTAQPGDTLIVHEKDGAIKLVYVPSGDEPTTSITVADSEKDVMSNKLGNVKLKFEVPFAITSEDNTATVALPTIGVEGVTLGLLTKSDYDTFQSYAAKSVSYAQTLTTGYEIGKFTFDSNTVTVYGKDTTYTLTTVNGATSGTNVSQNPKLIFAENGNTIKAITLKGEGGLIVNKDSDDVISFTSNNTVEANSTDYLAITGSQFQIKLGSVDEEGTITEGLVNYSTLSSYVNALNQRSTLFETVTYSLSGATNDSEYRYGNQKLIDAIEVTI